MTKEANWVGILLILFGIFLLVITKLHVAAIIYGSIAIIFGLIIIFFNKEDKIEERKDTKKKS